MRMRGTSARDVAGVLVHGRTQGAVAGTEPAGLMDPGR